MSSGIVSNLQMKDFRIRKFHLVHPSTDDYADKEGFFGFYAAKIGHWPMKVDGTPSWGASIVLSMRISESETLETKPEASPNTLFVEIDAQSTFFCPQAVASQEQFIEAVKKSGASAMISILRGHFSAACAALGVAPSVRLPLLNVHKINWTVDDLSSLSEENKQVE